LEKGEVLISEVCNQKLAIGCEGDLLHKLDCIHVEHVRCNYIHREVLDVLLICVLDFTFMFEKPLLYQCHKLIFWYFSTFNCQFRSVDI
jgi:hypothetical protein